MVESAAKALKQMQLPASVQSFFNENNWQIFDFQAQAWQAYLAGESGLIHSSTGSGKTLAAWFGPIIECLQAQQQSDQFAPLTVLWVTPLRALAEDTMRTLSQTITRVQVPWSIGKRTGDTSAAERARQKKKLPSVLITTPESLSLLLSYKDTARQFKKLRSVVVDEWHELLGSKRGVQLELCLARLKKLQSRLRVWGLSATIGNLPQAADVLTATIGKATVIRGVFQKDIRIESIIPKQMERFPWSGHLGLKQRDQVIDCIEKANSTLVFTNTRSQCEQWFEALLLARTDWIGTLAIHHGSLSKKIRLQVEEGIRTGRFKCVVCTSSLDLGVDFSPVEQVLQVGSPKGVARLLQRAGRSGHQPGAVSRVVCVPTHAFELIEAAAVRVALRKNQIEHRIPLQLSLDVLVQHLSTIALGGGFKSESMLKEVKTTFAFRALNQQQWQWALDFISRGGAALQHYPEYQRVEIKEGLYQLKDRRMGRMHRMSIGTISSDGMLRVKMRRGQYLGQIEEFFVSRLKKGECFLFNGRILELIRIRDMTAEVKPGSKKSRVIPRWLGGRMSLSNELSDQVRSILLDAEEAQSAEMLAVKPILEIQQQRSRLPHKEELLVEITKTREGTHIYMFTFAGRAINAGLVALLCYRLTQIQQCTFTSSVNDYGLELLSKNPPSIDLPTIEKLLEPEHLLRDLLLSINQSELARRQFRDIARIAGLVFQGYPGNRKSMRQIQTSSGLIFDVLNRHDSENLLLEQAQQEVLNQELDQQGIGQALERIQSQRICLHQVERLSPLAFPLWADRLRTQTISSEQWHNRIERMLKQLNKK